MKVEYLPSFVKDLKNLKSVPEYEAIKTLIFEEILNYSNLTEIRNSKRLKGDTNAYRIRVGDYRIGIFAKNEAVIFSRVLHRRDIYRYFP